MEPVVQNMENLFRMVLTVSMFSSVTGLAILALKALLKDKLTPKWHYAIWIVLFIRLLVPYGPKSPFSVYNLFQKDPLRTSPGYYIIQDENGNENGASAFDNQVGLQESNVPDIGDQPLYVQTGENEVSDMAQPDKANLTRIVTCVWIIGMILLSAWLVWMHFWVARKLKKVQQTGDTLRILKILDGCKEKLNIKRNIRVIIQERFSAPCLYQVTAPCILLHPDILSATDKELEYMIMHELAHYKRKDLVVNNLMLLLLVIHWFNPILWYCFKCIRQDMESAVDSYVLSVLEDSERLAYGRSLVTVLEYVMTPRPFPKPLCMTDDKRNIQRRIELIKKSDYFKSKKQISLLIGIVCITVLGIFFLTNGLSKELSNDVSYAPTNLYRYHSLYVGDNSNTANLVYKLPGGEYVKRIELFTDEKPYGLKVKYELSEDNINENWILDNNAYILFTLIGNLDRVSFQVKDIAEEVSEYEYLRSDLEERLGLLFSTFSESEDVFGEFLESLMLKVAVYPERYTPAMSMVPGLRIQAVYAGSTNDVTYQCENGVLLSWDPFTGKISKREKTTKIPYGREIYWSPLAEEKIINQDTITIKVKDEKDNTTHSVTIQIDTDEKGFCTVAPTLNTVIGVPKGTSQSILPTSLDDAVANAIKAQGNDYKNGEILTEGHFILARETSGKTVTVYTVASIGWFGFENGVFTKVSGSGSIPTVMRFTVTDDYGYRLTEYKEPLDGTGYSDSIKKMFPKDVYNRLYSDEEKSRNQSLKEQQEQQAAAYLESIGRKATVTCDYVEKTLPDINVQASNKLFSEYTKYDDFLNCCPYWIGTREYLENSVRYIYETYQGKSREGYAIIGFRKTTEDGTLIKEVKYLINGSNVEKLDE